MNVANDNSPTASIASEPVVVGMFSPYGPCLALGKLVRSTARFHVFTDWRGTRDFTGRERRMSSERVHLVPCPSCRDQRQTQFPSGYMD